MTAPVDEAFERFLVAHEEVKQRDQARQQRDQEIIANKDRLLIPLRKLLARLVDMNLLVHNTQRCSGYFNAPAVSFRVTEGPSSPHWAPGNSLYIEHPAEIEIAIPNAADREREGEVVLRCISLHPDAAMLNGPFSTMAQACNALAEFLGRNTEVN